MAILDYDAPASLYATNSPKQMRYYSFGHASLAIQFAVEGLQQSQLRGCVMEVGERRFRGNEIQQFYDAADYPLPRGAVRSAA